MSGPYYAADVFETPKGYEPLVCDDPATSGYDLGPIPQEWPQVFAFAHT